MTQQCFPILTPPFPYIMNGVTLNTPAFASGPLLTGGSVMTGATFSLIFMSASTSTQNALVNGANGTMTFAAHDGSKMNGIVKVTRSTSGSLLLATMMVLATIPVNHAVIVTQFY